jgi:NAD+ synthase (glutamine-hydrolysing)
MRLALVPLNPTVGDVQGNAALIAAALDRARNAGADLVVFPELSLCGYPPKDLLLAEGFVEVCIAAAKDLGEKHTQGLTAVFGLPLPHDRATYRAGQPIHNSLLVYRDNAFVDYYDKQLLPTYDVFDEDRYFVPGSRTVVIDVPCKALADKSARTVRVGLAICEDLWKGQDAGFSHRYADAADPVAALIRAGARMIVSPSASPFVLGKQEKHRTILSSHAKNHGIPVISLNQLGANDDLIFDGHALMFSAGGSIAAAGPLFQDDLVIINCDDRLAATSAPITAEPCDEEQLFRALVLGIRDYLRKTGFKQAIIGLSGGIDSALTAALAIAAIGPGNVLGVALPGVYSSEHSKADAYDLAGRLGMECPTVSIEPPLHAFRGVLDPLFRARNLKALGEQLPDITEENIQSRIRGLILMTLSNRTGAIVLTTGNKSELAVGYCTLYGDMNGGLAVLSDVSKMMVYSLSRWINANHALCGFAQPPIPQRSIDKAPSAELRPDQTDQDSLPPYDILDEIIERHVERRQSPDTIIRETGFDASTVERCVRLIDLSEYKRKQAAIGLKVTTVAFGSGRRVPIAQRWPG